MAAASLGRKRSSRHFDVAAGRTPGRGNRVTLVPEAEGQDKHALRASTSVRARPESTSLPFEMRQVCSMAVSPACTGCFSQSRATLFISSLSAAPIKTPCRCIDRLVSMEGRKGRACGIDGSGSRLILPTNLHEGPGQPGNWLLAHAISQAPGSATPESGSTCT